MAVCRTSTYIYDPNFMRKVYFQNYLKGNLKKRRSYKLSL